MTVPINYRSTDCSDVVSSSTVHNNNDDDDDESADSDPDDVRVQRSKIIYELFLASGDMTEWALFGTLKDQRSKI